MYENFIEFESLQSITSHYHMHLKDSVHVAMSPISAKID